MSAVSTPSAQPSQQRSWLVEREPAVLVLEDGRTFRGESYGAVGETVGEAVFSTGMTGYQETLTDPSYHRQVVVMTAPHVGNTGVNDEDDESRRIWVAGYVVRDPAMRPSSWRSQPLAGGRPRRPGRRRHLRRRHPRAHPAPARARRDAGRRVLRRGAPRSRRTPCSTRVRAAAPMTGAALAAEVTTAEPYVVPAVGEQAVHRRGARPRDQGDDADAAGRSRGIEVHVLPATTTFEQISELGVDGVFFSNGPGDPASAEHEITVLRQVLDARIPFFGICFGNQLLGPGARLRHLQAQVRPPRHQPAGARPQHRQGRGDRAQPRLRRRRPARRRGGGAQRRRARHVVRAGARLARLPQRRRGRGAASAWTCRRTPCSTTRRRPPARTTPATCSTGSSR